MQLKRVIVGTTIAVLSIVPIQIGCKGGGQNTNAEPRAGQNSKAEQEVRQVERELADATLRSDTSVLARIFADDSIFTGSSGEVLTKAKMLPIFESGNLKFETFNTDDIDIRVAGETAVVTGRAIIKGHIGDSGFNSQERFTRVYVKQNGRWQLLASHLTTIAH